MKKRDIEIVQVKTSTHQQTIEKELAEIHDPAYRRFTGRYDLHEIQCR